jgi:hypothetical protein
MRRKLYAQEDVCVGTMVLYANGVVCQWCCMPMVLYTNAPSDW